VKICEQISSNRFYSI